MGADRDLGDAEIAGDLASTGSLRRRMIEALDREAKRLGVPRGSVIKVWIADRLERTVA